MKKVLTMMMMAVVCLIMTSCKTDADYKSVADKISAGESLTESDYSVMIDYCADYAEKAQPYFDVINSGADPSSKEYADATNALADMSANAVYLDTFRNAIFSATADQLGESNVKKLDSLSKYEAMPIGDVSDSAMLNPDVVGDIEDMPATDTGNVIANGDGEVVVAK
ncbi:MAG: hypothetical protein K2L89_08970 [Muribaculaceae bacterium]|nr:hypothetical protein [Muribaculaceae bacterium]